MARLVAAALAAQVTQAAAKAGWRRIDHVAVTPSEDERGLDVALGIKHATHTGDAPQFDWVYSCRVPLTADADGFVAHLLNNVEVAAKAVPIALA